MPDDEMTAHDLCGVYAVPPLPRSAGARRTIDFDAASRIVEHIHDGGVTRFLYGGNAFVYHMSMDEYECLAGWLAQFEPPRLAIPSLGPSFGRAIDQARVLRRHGFSSAMLLPCSDPRDAAGMEAGVREIAQTAGLPLVLYLKSEDAFGTDLYAGLEAIGRLVGDGVALAVKYAVVRQNPNVDPYLTALLGRVDRTRVLSGIGERPAIAHLRDFELGGMTTGSGCIAPGRCAAFFTACTERNWTHAERLRETFMPLEDLRDAWGPARVLHHATELCGIASTGPIPPFVSALDDDQLQQLAPIAKELREADA
jgi:dihydrodipicolinate synthase/N-acetylneuraminate lyase